MAESKCLLVKCDRCGTEIMRKYIGRKILQYPVDVDEYEPIPDGWDAQMGRNVCPDCNREFKRLMDEFWRTR